MPRRRRYARRRRRSRPAIRRRKRLYRRRRSVRRRAPRVQVIRGQFPEKALVNLPYFSYIEYPDSNPSNPANPYLLSGNDLIGPDLSGTVTHQPLGFDEWSPLYNKFLVTKCTLTLWIQNYKFTKLSAPTIVVTAAHIGKPRNLSAGLDGQLEAYERPGYRKYQLPPSDNGKSVVKMKMTNSTRRVYGQNYVQSKSDENGGNTSGLPIVANGWQWKIWYLTPQGGYDSNPASGAGFHGIIRYRMDYRVTFYDRRVLQLS
ncbi:MAG: capsid protein [Circoviridae sp.]|nr:MAG: capsid protein [Circoviridae sp.]